MQAVRGCKVGVDLEGMREASLRKVRGEQSGKSSRRREQHRHRSPGNVRENKEVQVEEGGRQGETQA